GPDPADHVAGGTARYQNALRGIAQRANAVRLHADPVALHLVARRVRPAQHHADARGIRPAVPGDDIVLPRRGAADGVARREDADAVQVGNAIGPGEVGADVVALDHVAGRALVGDRDSVGVHVAGNDVGDDGVARGAVADVHRAAAQRGAAAGVGTEE